jgi:hypothetical protein
MSHLHLMGSLLHAFERVEHPVSRNALEDMRVHAPMEIMMAGSPGDICLFACSPQSSGDAWQLQSCSTPECGCWCPSDIWWPRSCPELWGHMAALELPRAVGARGSPEATPSWEREPEPRRHMAASELPPAGRLEPLS